MSSAPLYPVGQVVTVADASTGKLHRGTIVDHLVGQYVIRYDDEVDTFVRLPFGAIDIRGEA